eukprot:CAMPEP_0195305642 /NCGR_PEP_ID=MMETSP0707-20130614/36657_1 /TAXON_ID=33640 /ORGANISM="Asterionellopsis glacialis, Strain CCMP134" /LENGTH=171 /DNA_ID=CAMNT_0040369811 /DNA_START=150 /DNA_END=665 /DNA_ORIENTATION=+
MMLWRGAFSWIPMGTHQLQMHGRLFRNKRNVLLNLAGNGESTDIRSIESSEAPEPVGPYSQAVVAGGMVYCSGQIALDPCTGDLVGEGNVEKETYQVLKNLDAVLKEAGVSAKNIVRMTVFLVDLDDFSAVNKIYANFFSENSVSPSRSCVQVAALPKGALVEMDCIATLN